MYKRILLAYDGSGPGQKALLDGLDIAQWSGAELFLVAVMPPSVPMMTVDGAVYDSEHDAQLKSEYAAILTDGLQRLAAAGRTARGEVLVGDTGWAARWWRGSTSPALIEHAHCSVLVVITR